MSTQALIPVNQRVELAERRETFAPKSIQEAFQFARLVLVSGMAPKAYREAFARNEDEGVAAVVVAIQFGLEVGFQPMQALQCIANINGMPSVWGDGALALVRSSGLLESIEEDDLEAIKTKQKATCIVRRHGDPIPRSVTFSYQDAIDAGIKSNAVWKTYPARMCQMRARAFALRDKFPDVLKGLMIAEEAQDYPNEATPRAPEKPAIQPTITEEQVKPAAAAEEPKPEEKKQPESVNKDDAPVGAEKARLFYEAYRHNHTMEEMRAELKRVCDISDTRLIPASKFDAMMQWGMSAGSLTKPAANAEAE